MTEIKHHKRLIPTPILKLANKYGVIVVRDEENCDRNQGSSAGKNLWLGEFDDPDLEIVAFFHELGHALLGQVLKGRSHKMSELSGEGTAWELGLGLAFENGYEWDYESKQLQYARKCFFSYLHSDATKLDIEEYSD